MSHEDLYRTCDALRTEVERLTRERDEARAEVERLIAVYEAALCERDILRCAVRIREACAQFYADAGIRLAEVLKEKP